MTPIHSNRVQQSKDPRDSPWSASVTKTPVAPIQLALPGAPSVGSLTAGDGALTVVWSAPSDNGGADITSYDLRYIRSDAANKSDANWTVEEDVWISGSLQYQLGGLTNGVGYDVQVRAMNSVGPGPWSEQRLRHAADSARQHAQHYLGDSGR